MPQQQSQFVRIEKGANRPSLDVGALRHAITIQSLGSTPAAPADAFSGSAVSGTWATFTTAMAAIDAIRGADVVKGGQTTAQLYLSVALWYQPGIAAGMRVVNDVNQATYLVQSVDNVLEMDVVLVLNCIGLGVNAK